MTGYRALSYNFVKSFPVLSEGFEIPSLSTVYLNTSDLFGHRTSSSRFMSRFKEASILKSYEELRPGDYVVHERHGIGIYKGIEKVRTSDGRERDYIHIDYADSGKLFIPVEQLSLIGKFASKDSRKPKLSIGLVSRRETFRRLFPKRIFRWPRCLLS